MTIDPKAFILDEEEQRYEDEAAAGERVLVENLEERREIFSIIAYNTIKRKSITLRPFEQDIEKIKAIAMEEWIPYQTKITAILHQFVRNWEKERLKKKKEEEKNN